MGFNAEQQLKPLEYDFSPYADLKGTSPEPSGDQIKDYWLQFQKLLKENRDALTRWEKRREDAEAIESAEDRLAALEKLDDEYEEWSDNNADYMRGVRMTLLSGLLSGSPSIEELKALPGRLFGLYEQSVQEDMSPNAPRSGTSS